jgi:glycine dehydrogenase subunit 1
MGKQGLRELAEINLSKGQYAKKKLGGSGRLRFPAPTFNEFVLTLDGEPSSILPPLLQAGFVGGLPLKRFYPEMEREVLVCVTEKHSKEDIDRFAAILGEIQGEMGEREKEEKGSLSIEG